MRGRGWLEPNRWVAFAVIVAFVAMRIWRLTAVSLDGDEIFGLLLARSPWHDLWAGAVRDAIHPPLFYFLLKIWVRIGGESLLWLRMFPVTASVLCLPPLFFLCRNLQVPPGARDFAIGIASVHPYALFYAQHVRMYCLLMLFGVVSAWLFERYSMDPSPKRLAALTIANALLVYSHYFGWLIVGLEFLYLLGRRRQVAAFLGSGLLTAILFAPWAWVAAHSLQAKGGLAENLGWVQRPAFADLIWFFVELTGFAEFPGIGVQATVCVLIFLALIYRRREGLHWLTVLCIAPAPVVFLVTQFPSQSIWGQRHLVFTLWPFLVVFADALWRQREAVRIVVMALTGVWAVFAAAQHATDDRKLSWDTLTLQMLDADQSGAAHVPFYAVDDYVRYPIWFYLDCLKNGWLGPFGPRRPRDHSALAEKAARVEMIQTSSLSEANGNYFWVGYSDTSWHEARSPSQVFEERGCTAGPELTGRYQFHRVSLFAVKCAK